MQHITRIRQYGNTAQKLFLSQIPYIIKYNT